MDDELESEIEEGTYEDLIENLQRKSNENRNAKSKPVKEPKEEQSHYIEVQDYEEDIENVETKPKFKKIKKLLLAMLVSGLVIAPVPAIMVNDNTVETTEDSQNDLQEEIPSLSNATDEQIEEAKEKLEQIIEDSGYEFENLSESELIDAYFRISYQLKGISETEYKTAFFSGKDQDNLDSIAESSYDEETYSNFTEEQIYDLRKLTYELTSNSVKESYLRDPENVPKTNSENEETIEIQEEK